MDKKHKFLISGHAFRRKFSYVEKGIYNEITAPGGAALIQQILSHHTPTKYKMPDNTSRCEHLELQWCEERQSKKSYYSIGRRIGMENGGTTPFEADAPYTIVWDEGLGGITPPHTPVLWASNKALPEKEPFQLIAHHCFLMLDADVLRNNGVLISRQVSWERAATELIWQMKNSPVLSHLGKVPHTLITFAEDGAVYIQRTNGNLTATLMLTHGGGENSLREKTKGQIDDTFAIMVATASLQFPDVIEQKQTLQVLPVLKAGETLINSGYAIDQLNNGTFYIPDKDACSSGTSIRSFDIPVIPGQSTIDPDFWCISNNVDNKRIFDIAYEYVLTGADIIEGLPQLSFGALTTIDRWEIESYQNVRNLIVGYANSGSVRPLSIAVFGAPGSGKSFGVTQIAKNILPDKVEKLEFNVSQLTGNADLGAAFQKVRDIVLEGKLPLVFFDEFDSDRDGIPLGWIKSFLMPMQDGKFKDDSGEHPLGKCILVFAGGTSPSFEEFIRPMLSDDPEEQQKFKNIKGPDFVSRLRGTINVLGPNRANENDKNYILRRALLLRSLCERKLKMKKGGDTPINKNILRAMLLVPKYKHGARSMEAILDMSRIEGNVWEPVSLPFYSQLSLHVDADVFIKLVLHEVILNSHVEELAKAIHEDYCRKQTERKAGDIRYNIPWDQLPEEIKDVNRDQAKWIGKYIHMIGCGYDASDPLFPSVEKFSAEEILFLAQQVHLVWMDSKLTAGWKYGHPRNDNKKIHPLIVDWEQLPEEEQQKDIDVIEQIIPLLKKIGLKVYRMV